MNSINVTSFLTWKLFVLGELGHVSWMVARHNKFQIMLWLTRHFIHFTAIICNFGYYKIITIAYGKSWTRDLYYILTVDTYVGVSRHCTGVISKLAAREAS